MSRPALARLLTASLFGLILAGGLAVGTLATGCKAGLGDRCQVEADCQDGLLCNLATNSCQKNGGGQLDATVPDAPAGSGDAAVDAAVDAAIDAPAVDAAIDAH
jgi:hypothetical protein